MTRPRIRNFWLWLGALAGLAGLTWLHQHGMSRRYRPGRLLHIGGQPIHVMEGGHPGAPTTVLIHGSDGVGLDWPISPLWQALAPHRRLLAYDRPGHGHSPVPPGQAVSIASNVRDLHLLLTAVGADDVTLVGHSYGASIALAYALQHPERVSKLVLINPVAFAAPGLTRPLAYVPLIPLLEALLTRVLLLPAGQAVALIEGRRAFWPAPVPPLWHRLMLDFSRRRMQVHALAAENRSMGRELAGLSEQYGELAVPVTLLSGRHDRLTPPQDHARPLAGRLKKVTWQELANGGHQLHWTHPEEVAGAVLT